MQQSERQRPLCLGLVQHGQRELNDTGVLGQVLQPELRGNEHAASRMQSGSWSGARRVQRLQCLRRRAQTQKVPRELRLHDWFSKFVRGAAAAPPNCWFAPASASARAAHP